METTVYIQQEISQTDIAYLKNIFMFLSELHSGTILSEGSIQNIQSRIISINDQIVETQPYNFELQHLAIQIGLLLQERSPKK